jgi:hypothetical protein
MVTSSGSSRIVGDHVGVKMAISGTFIINYYNEE